MPEDALGAFLFKVTANAQRITDEDLEQRLAAGTSEDALWELTLAAALGEADRRLARGYAALRAAGQS